MLIKTISEQLLCAKTLSSHFIFAAILRDSITINLSDVKRGPREVKWLVDSHTATKWQRA